MSPPIDIEVMKAKAVAEDGRRVTTAAGLARPSRTAPHRGRPSRGVGAADWYFALGVPRALVLGMLTCIASLIPSVGTALVPASESSSCRRSCSSRRSSGASRSSGRGAPPRTAPQGREQRRRTAHQRVPIAAGRHEDPGTSADGQPHGRTAEVVGRRGDNPDELPRLTAGRSRWAPTANRWTHKKTTTGAWSKCTDRSDRFQAYASSRCTRNSHRTGCRRRACCSRR